MTVETFDINEQLVSVTPAAAEHFRSSLDGSTKDSVRISVQESGCTGFKYVVEEVETSQEGDIVIALDNGVHLFLDREAVNFLRGSEIDYAREGINRTLVFKNPNVTAECGCGESFSIN